MAGGYGRGARIPLRDRVRTDQPPEQTRASDLAHPYPVVSPARHCWVSTPTDAGQPCPGLLLRWQRGEDRGWVAEVVYMAQLRPGEWAVVIEWLDADQVTATLPS